jgi:hypothetical protein
MKPLSLVVFGTSILWGQGLEDRDKTHNVLARMLENHMPERVINTYLIAHSGASTGYKRDGTVDTRQLPRIHGEVPTLYPTILQQIDSFGAVGDSQIDPASVDIILLDAGVNDVHVTQILDPLTSPKEIAYLVDLYCYQHMLLLLKTLTQKFSRAKVFILGYYEILTEHSEDGYLHRILKGLGKVADTPLMDHLLTLFNGLLKRRLLKNCDVFASRSLASFQQAAQEVNSGLSTPCIYVVPSVIDAHHAAFTSDPWVFGIKDDLSPEDAMAQVRSVECECAGPTRTEVFFCKIASAGHPNREGAQAHARALLNLIIEKVAL